MNKLVLPKQIVQVNSTAISTAIYEYETYRLKLTFNNGSSSTTPRFLTTYSKVYVPLNLKVSLLTSMFYLYINLLTLNE